MAEQLAPERIAEVQEIYSMFDRDGDGAINTAELGAVLRSVGFNPTDAEVASLSAEFDSEDSGSLDFSDFLMLLGKVDNSGDSLDEVDEAFRVFDTEGTGYISVAEFRNIMTTRGEKLTVEEVEEMLTNTEIDERGQMRYEDCWKWSQALRKTKYNWALRVNPYGLDDACAVLRNLASISTKVKSNNNMDKKKHKKPNPFLS